MVRIGLLTERKKQNLRIIRSHPWHGPQTTSQGYWSYGVLHLCFMGSLLPLITIITSTAATSTTATGTSTSTPTFLDEFNFDSCQVSMVEGSDEPGSHLARSASMFVTSEQSAPGHLAGN